MSKDGINPGDKKKTSILSIMIYGVITLFIFYLAAALGTALDLSVGQNGKIQGSLVGNNFNTAVSSPNIIFEFIDKGGFTPKVLFFTFVGIGLFALYKYSQIKKRLHRKGVEHGSAKWGDSKEMQSLKDNGEKTKEPIFKAALTSDGKRVFDENGEFVGFLIDNNIILTKEVYMSLNSRQHLMNLNVLIIGGSGSGKTRFYAKPNILQLNTSYVITDPKGEILQAVGKLLIEAGYDLKVFNLIEMEHSNNYNPFNYVYDYDGNLSEDSITKMIDVFMKNTKGEGEKEDFWSQSATKTITAIVFLLFEESEYNAEFDENGMIKPETRDFSHLNFYSVTEKMRKLTYPPSGSADGYFLERGKDESDEDYTKRRKEAFLCPLDYDFIELEKRKGETLAVRLYKEIRNSPQETGQSIIATAGSRTQMFNLKKLADLTCCDNIHIETLGDKKTAMFIIISATNSTYNFLAAMMYSQMFDILANRANFKYGGVLPVHVRCIMDEFANIGQIPDFDKVIAFVRSMGMSLNVIIQNLAQLKARYEKTWEVITGNCDSLLFLGGKEASTLKEMSESLGKETIDIEARNRTKTAGNKSNSTSESNSIVGRELMTQDELQKMPISNCVLMIRSHNPFYCHKFPIEKHPNYRFTEDFDKKNAFDKYSIKVKTLEEFKAENNVQKDDELSETIDVTREKLKLIYPKEGENIEIDSETVDFDYETYEEAEMFGGGGGFEVIEEIGSEVRYGIPSELQSFEMPEPNPDYREVVNHDEEIYVEFSLDEKEEHDIEDIVEYDVPYEEAEQIEDLNEEDVQWHTAGQTETYTMTPGFYSTDTFTFAL